MSEENVTAPSESAIKTDVTAFILDNFLFGDEAAMPSDAESLIDSGVLDSTGVLELIEFLEEHFAIAVSDDETVPSNLGSVDNLVGYVLRKTR